MASEVIAEAVEATACGAATYLRNLADRIEAAGGHEVLIGLWNTGFGEPYEFCFQAVIDSDTCCPSGGSSDA